MVDFSPWSMADTWELLVVIQTFDDRNFEEAHALSWNAMANAGRWPMDLALEAVREHYLNSTALMQPANVQAYVREHKQDRAMREVVRELPSGGDGGAAVRRYIESNWRSDDELALSMLEVPCPFEGCRVAASQPCNLGGFRLRDPRKRRYQPHPGRHIALSELARSHGLDPTWDAPECPTCGAPAGLRCMNLSRGSYLSDRLNPHMNRLDRAA